MKFHRNIFNIYRIWLGVLLIFLSFLTDYYLSHWGRVIPFIVAFIWVLYTSFDQIYTTNDWIWVKSIFKKRNQFIEWNNVEWVVLDKSRILIDSSEVKLEIDMLDKHILEFVSKIKNNIEKEKLSPDLLDMFEERYISEAKNWK